MNTNLNLALTILANTTNPTTIARMEVVLVMILDAQLRWDRINAEHDAARLAGVKPVARLPRFLGYGKDAIAV